jgi:hypothetical protein
MSGEALRNPQESRDRTAAEAPRSGIVWLASYPKSGNTWTRTFLHNLVHVTSGDAQVQQINELNQFSLGSAARPLYEEILGFVPTNEHLDQIAAARAGVQQYIADTVEGLIFVKTHQALVVDRGHITINFAVTSGAIYIVRNPLDVAISYAHHLGKSIDFAIDFMNLKNAEALGSEKHVYEVYGSWSQHVLSWTRKPHPAIYVMRYEDMLAARHSNGCASRRKKTASANAPKTPSGFSATAAPDSGRMSSRLSRLRGSLTRITSR